MARPVKDGLDYFPLDVDIFDDEKIEAISGEFGIKGELTVIKLLCAVYKKGYFIVWNDLVKAQLLNRLPGVSKDLLEQIVTRLVLWGFFDKSLFDSANVLTSERIQSNYFEATKRRKVAKPTLYVINVDNNTQVDEINVDINTQSKVKKSKVNEIKENNNKDTVVVINDVSKIAKLYENAGFGQINALVAENLKDIVEQYDFLWIEEAFNIAVVNNKHSLAYVKGILENWRSKGKNSPKPSVKNGDKKTKFHNFKQLSDKYSEDDLEDMARKKREAAIAKFEEVN